jgi:3-hydroxy-9,10-secoandrosta-1,3,5(10)-triene-9,17-dione monooxygenase
MMAAMESLGMVKAASIMAAPEPDLTARELLARARALRSRLREAQMACESGGRVPQDIADEMVRLGLFRIVQPRKYGGYEFDLPTFYKAAIEISRGCSETGWVYSLVGGHPLMLARFSEQAQQEVYANGGDVRCPGALSPPGLAIPVEGGYRITNNWVSASGCDLATHFMGLARVQGSVGVDGPRLIQAIFDIADCTIFDDWQVMGMRGTGSKQVQVSDVFVPEYRTLEVAGAIRGDAVLATPSHGLDNPIYSAPVAPFLIGETAAVAVGAAWGALDLYEDILRTKKTQTPPIVDKCQDPVSQIQYGAARALAATAEAALIKTGQDYETLAAASAKSGQPFDAIRETELVLIAQRCVNMAWEAVDLIYRAGGTTASAKTGKPIGRIQRNLSVLRTHPVLQFEQTQRTVAKLIFGL